MRIPLDWLLEYIDDSKKLSTDDVANALTSIGLEVESIEKSSNHKSEIFEINVTPNRADCLGVIGIARELAAKLELKLILPETQFQSSTNLQTSKKLQLEVNSEICPRFVALAISQVHVVTSPLWLQNRLEAAGIRPQNLLVDITNYVMLEYSQPIHAYDQKDIQGAKIGVRFAKSGEKLVTLDNKEQILSTDDIVIVDGHKAIGLAGVMGGQNSEIKATTKDVFIEVACFAPTIIRKTAKKYAYHTEASYRFERGVDIQNLKIVASRVATLLQKCMQELQVENPNLPSPEIASDFVDFYPQKLHPRTIALRPSKLIALGGCKFSTQQITRYLERLEIRLLDQASDRMLFETPTWRLDLERETDLIEEVLRLHGFDHIPTQLPKMSIEPNSENPFIDFCTQTRRSFASYGLSETISYSFVGKSQLQAWQNSSQADNYVELANPLNEELNCLRPSLIPSLLNAVVYNKRFATEGIRIFEIGRVFCSESFIKTLQENDLIGPKDKSLHLHDVNFEPARPCERLMISGLISTPYIHKSWNKAAQNSDFFIIKSYIERFLKGLHLKANYLPIDENRFPYLHPGQSCLMLINQVSCGVIGSVHPKVLQNYGLSTNEPIHIFECNLEKIFTIAAVNKPIYQNLIHNFPSSGRDLALLVPKDCQHAQIMAKINELPQSKAPHLISTQLFDLYQGEHVQAGFKSMAYRFVFEATDRTLIDTEVDQQLQEILKWLNTSLGLQQRV